MLHSVQYSDTFIVPLQTNTVVVLSIKSINSFIGLTEEMVLSEAVYDSFVEEHTIRHSFHSKCLGKKDFLQDAYFISFMRVIPHGLR